MTKYVVGKWDLSGLVPNPKTPAFTKQIQVLENVHLDKHTLHNIRQRQYAVLIHQ